MPDDNPNEDLEAEGIPDIEEPIPGQDVETSDEGMMAPRDHSVAAGSDPAYPNTAAEERAGESVAARARRENPDFGQGDFGRDQESDRSPRLMEPDSDIDEVDVTAEEVADIGEDTDGGLTAEESAMHIVSEDVADDVDPDVEAREYTGDR
jgi:hypothetical protein